MVESKFNEVDNVTFASRPLFASLSGGVPASISSDVWKEKELLKIGIPVSEVVYPTAVYQ
jgi:hypothetical protein